MPKNIARCLTKFPWYGLGVIVLDKFFYILLKPASATHVQRSRFIKFTGFQLPLLDGISHLQ
jgi:hypothetical protein